MDHASTYRDLRYLFLPRLGGNGCDEKSPLLEDDFDGKGKSGKAAAAVAFARAAGMADSSHGEGKRGNDDFGPNSLAGNVGAVLQAAAAAAAVGANSNRWRSWWRWRWRRSQSVRSLL